MQRQRPTITVAPHAPPSSPEWIYCRHPDLNLCFLRLPALDYYDSAFGLHLGTVITACEILAYNKPGYLSRSHNRDDPGHGEDGFNSMIPPGQYYYHLRSPEPEMPYQICVDFSSWTFPHGRLPGEWGNMISNTESPIDCPANASAFSEKIRDRDTKCLISGSRDSLTAAHIVPKAHEFWLSDNYMEPFLCGGPSLSFSPSNLFAIWYDLYLGQFDEAKFVIIPKFGEFVVHFLDTTFETAQHYHNVQFNHGNTLSHEALYVRFAWALIKHAKPFLANIKVPRAPGGGHGGGEGSGEGGGEGSGHGGDGSEGGDIHHSDRITALRGTKRKHNEGQDWGGQPLQDDEAEELQKDLKTAAKTLTFFVDPNRAANPYHYETLQWYPGSTIVERRKQAYLESHPQIRAHSDEVLPNDYNSSDENSM